MIAVNLQIIYPHFRRLRFLCQHDDIQEPWARILVEVTIYRRLLIGRDGHLDQSEAYDIS